MTRWARASAHQSERGFASTGVCMRTNVRNGIEQAASKASAAVLGAGYTPPGMHRPPWLVLVRDQARAGKLLGNVLVDGLEGV